MATPSSSPIVMLEQSAKLKEQTKFIKQINDQVSKKEKEIEEITKLQTTENANFQTKLKITTNVEKLTNLEIAKLEIDRMPNCCDKTEKSKVTLKKLKNQKSNLESQLSDVKKEIHEQEKVIETNEPQDFEGQVTRCCI